MNRFIFLLSCAIVACLLLGGCGSGEVTPTDDGSQDAIANPHRSIGPQTRPGSSS